MYNIPHTNLYHKNIKFIRETERRSKVNHSILSYGSNGLKYQVSPSEKCWN